MFDAETQSRFNKSCTEAMVNYLSASGAVYQSMADQMLRMWSQSVDAVLDSSRKAGFSSRDESYPRRERPPSSANFMMPWAAVPQPTVNANPLASFSPFGKPYGFFSPFAPWLEMMSPLQMNAWPMAVGMISVGVPEQIAWPTARGNVAAMDAFSVAAKSVQRALEEYKAEPQRVRPATIVEETGANPFTVMFAIAPLNPALLMQFFAPFRPK